MPNPILTALGASVGSIALMGAATMVVASTSLAVIQKVSNRQKVGPLYIRIITNRYAFQP